ncbi:MAG: DUF6034 family protein [Lachnospiraceae bacterium]|nr:DUF6034 family protein [Lachnospiraceae bacterium]
MKKKIVPILSGILALTMLSGCGAPQAQTGPTTVNQAMLIEKSSQPQETYSFPDRFTGDWTTQEGKLTIHADASVVAEQGVVLPTATVTPREFTQEDVEKLLTVFLKGEPLYEYVQTKQELQDWIDYINSPEWRPDPDAPEQTPEQIEQRRKDIIAYHTKLMETAPEEKPIVHGFHDSGDPKEVSGSAVVDGVEYEVSIRNQVGEPWTRAIITRHDYKYMEKQDWGGISKEEAITLGDALTQALGLDEMQLDDAQQRDTGEWLLCYMPTVNGIRLPSIRQDVVETHEGEEISHFQYYTYLASEETNADPVSWPMETVWIHVGKDGILDFTWQSPTGETIVKEKQTALLPFEEIASIANTMLPVVIVGPKSHSLVDLDHINGFDTKMDVEITKVSLTLMRIRDKGSLQGTIVPVWDFWGTWDWYDAEPNAYGYNEKGMNYTTGPMLTLNAIDGSVVSRELGY